MAAKTPRPRSGLWRLVVTAHGPTMCGPTTFGPSASAVVLRDGIPPDTVGYRRPLVFGLSAIDCCCSDCCSRCFCSTAVAAVADAAVADASATAAAVTAAAAVVVAGVSAAAAAVAAAAVSAAAAAIAAVPNRQGLSDQYRLCSDSRTKCSKIINK